jgi:hypothetical protein
MARPNTHALNNSYPEKVNQAFSPLRFSSVNAFCRQWKTGLPSTPSNHKSGIGLSQSWNRPFGSALRSIRTGGFTALTTEFAAGHDGFRR